MRGPRWYELTVQIPYYDGEIVIGDWLKWCRELERCLTEILPIKVVGGVTWKEMPQ